MTQGKPHVLIMAGGSGTRLWPLSRRTRPKFLCDAGTGRTLLDEALLRALTLTSADLITVVTGAQHANTVRTSAQHFGVHRLLVEPEPRDTAPAVVAGSFLAGADATDTLVVSLPADHLVDTDDHWHTAMDHALKAAHAGDLTCLAVPPSRPETGFGYIQAPGAADTPRRATAFHEKPDAPTAQRYLAQGDHYWNTAIMAWRADRLQQELARHAPTLAATVDRALDRGHATLDPAAWSQVPAGPIETALLAPAAASGALTVVPAPLRWTDVGNWEAYLRTCARSPEATTAAFHSPGSVVVRSPTGSDAERRFVLLGVAGILVVDCGDVVLIADQRQTPELKQVVTALAELGWKDAL
jgi:mannose-1-phosphate guanylyltransferase